MVKTVQKIQLTSVDITVETRYCEVYKEEDIQDIEIHYTEDGFPLEYSWSAYIYAAHLAWRNFCAYNHLKPSIQKKLGAYKLNFKDLKVDPKGDYRDLLEVMSIENRKKHGGEYIPISFERHELY